MEKQQKHRKKSEKSGDGKYMEKTLEKIRDGW